MEPGIVFTDAGGTVTVTNGLPFPGNRFNGWTPDSPPIKSESRALATGRPFPVIFAYRETASLTLDHIPNDRQDDVLRLIRWLESGGVVTVHTGDADDRSYTQCYLAEGARPSFTLSDPKLLEYALSVTLLNVAGTRMLCRY